MKQIFRIMIQDSANVVQTWLIEATDYNTAVAGAQTKAGVTTPPMQIIPFGVLDLVI